MSLHYRYKLLSVPQPVWSLGGRFVRPRPMIHVALIGPAGTAVRQAQVDPGADDTVFSDALAAQIGIDLSNAPTGSAAAVGGQTIKLRYAEVTLRITDGKERREWPARVGFAPIKLRNPLLGFAGCLQFFTATFLGDREELELTVNSLYPGT